MQEVKWLVEYLDSQPTLQEIEDSIETLIEWAGTTFPYQSKNLRIREWSPEQTDFYNLVCHIYACVLLHPQGITYQALIGYISGNIRCADPLDRAKCAAEVIAICYLCELIVITKVSDKTMMITTEHLLNTNLPMFMKHVPETKKPAPSEYIPILGNCFKKHDQDVCKDHIDRMNSVAFTLESRLIDLLPETPTAELETPEQQQQWADFVNDSYIMYLKIIMGYDNQFYLLHNHDTRGRCYCSGYYINYQGSSYKKAIVQLANKEVVKL
jgi:hypothetical protein